MRPLTADFSCRARWEPGLSLCHRWEAPPPPQAPDTDLVVVGAVRGLLHGRVLLVVAHLHTHHGVHVQAHQLPRLDHCDADLRAGEGEGARGRTVSLGAGPAGVGSAGGCREPALDLGASLSTASNLSLTPGSFLICLQVGVPPPTPRPSYWWEGEGGG